MREISWAGTTTTTGEEKEEEEEEDMPSMSRFRSRIEARGLLRSLSR